MAQHWEEAGEYCQMPLMAIFGWKTHWILPIRHPLPLRPHKCRTRKKLWYSSEEESRLDMNKLKSDFENETIKAFEEDLNLKAQMGVRGFPSIFFLDKDGNRFLVYGSKPYEKYEEVLLKLFPEAKKKVYETDPVSLFQKHPTFTTKEFVVLSGKEMKEAENFLEELAAQGKIQKQVSKNGPLWIKADF